MKLETLVLEMAGIILPKLLKDKKISVGAVTFEAYWGDTEWSFLDHDGSHFELEIGEQLMFNQSELTRTIAHELIHVAQLLRGDVFDFSKPYYEQAHEIEAYALEDEMMNLYEESIK